jgi:hypothetical protein
MELTSVSTQITRRVEGRDSVYIAPLGDIQWNGEPEEIWVEGLKQYIKEAIRLNAWFIGMGDYIDFASPSNRFALESSKVYDSARKRMDSAARETVHEVYDKFLKPTKGRWLGMLEGHHFFQYLDGSTTDQELCRLLDAPFLGTSNLLQMAIYPYGKQQDSSITYTILSHHGTAGSSESAMLLRMKRYVQYWEGVDLFLMGHSTKKPTTPIPRIRPNFKSTPASLTHRDVYLVGTGGWLKNLVEGNRIGRVARGGYPEKNMLDPVSLGAPLIRLDMLRRNKHTHREPGHTYIRTRVVV